ncbi:MAG: alpha/beta family hydrolase [Rhodospirillales bacterium]
MKAAVPALLVDGPEGAPLTIILAHGAGAPMDSPFMAYFAAAIAAGGYRVVRFEFPYMAERRYAGTKRPPDRSDILLTTWRTVVAMHGPAAQLVIGGKSMGGRMASQIADETGAAGLLCLGYPFHPPGRPEQLRTAHLLNLATPTLIVQGTRDPLGSATEVPKYSLSPAIRVHWLADGDHSFKPRASSGRTADGNLEEGREVIIAWLAQLNAGREMEGTQQGTG